MTKPGLGKGLNSLLDETKPLTPPAKSQAEEKNVTSDAQAVKAEKVKFNGLKVLLKSKHTQQISAATPVENARHFLRPKPSVLEKNTRYPLWLLIIADFMLICLAFLTIFKSKENPSVSDLLLSMIAVCIGAALVCWGVWQKNREN